jgi:hypothetical protein
LKLLFSNISFWEKLSVKWTVFGRMWGAEGFDFSKFLTLVIALLQALAWSLLLFVVKTKKSRKEHERRVSELEGAGVGASLALLGTGCSSCGVSLIAPITAALFSSGGYLIAAITSWIFTLGALLLSFFTVKRLGLDSYMIKVSEKRGKNEIRN